MSKNIFQDEYKNKFMKTHSINFKQTGNHGALVNYFESHEPDTHNDST